MLECEKELWRDLLKSYKEMTYLWDTKDRNYQNKKMRSEGFDKLLRRYVEIDTRGTVAILKKRLENMRTAYQRERKKVEKSIQNGDPEPHMPTLWYYDLLGFLEDRMFTPMKESKENGETFRFNFNRSKNKIYLEKHSSGNRLKRKKDEPRRSMSSDSRGETRQGYINIEPLQSSEEESPTPQRQQTSAPKRRIYDLLQKQEKFVDIASKLLVKKEKDWEVIGKAIGLQLSALESEQQTIAQKLISDTIFYGNVGKLTMDSFVNIEPYAQASPQSDIVLINENEEIIYEEPLLQ